MFKYSRKKIAANVEREVLRLIWDFGYAALRVAGSGSSSYPASDLIARIGDELYIIEVKSTHSERIRINEEQQEQLSLLADKFKAKILIVLKFFGKGIYCSENLRTTYTMDDKDLIPFKLFLESKKTKKLA